LIDVRALDCDFLACSPYKFFGPHMGCIYGKRELLLRFPPYKVRPAPAYLPDRWETGTQIHEGLAGVTAAIDYLADVGRNADPSMQENHRAALVSAYRAIRHYEMGLAKRMIAGLLEIPGVRFY
jgi:selenocysteine lyase/cysteine desulfurase